MTLSPLRISQLDAYAQELAAAGDIAAADEIRANLLSCPVKSFPGLGIAPVTPQPIDWVPFRGC